MSTGCPKMGGGVTINEKQLVANRANAKKSTGPKTQAGKAIVALNSIAHGIYCISPVIEGSESKRGWTAYRFAMLDNLAPIGMLEMTLAERIILTAWRLRRITHFETEQIRIAQESAFEDVGRSFRFKLDADEVDIQKILDEPAWREWRCRSVSALATASDTTALSAEEAEDLLWYVHEQLAQTEDFERYCNQLTAPDVWQMGWIRQLIRGLCEKHRKPFDEFLRTLSTRAAEEHAKSLNTAKLAHASLEKYRREHLLPANEDLEKVQRYEAHLSRQFHRDLHELQRLQAARLGHPVPAPIAIDVDVSTESKTETRAAD
jgi:hypothetical protein